MRSLTQVVVQDQATANAIAQRAKGGQALDTAAGTSAAVTTLKDQTREAYVGVAGEKAATAVFAASTGSVVGPVQSEFGWVVVKIDSVRAGGGRTLAQARAEIAAKLTAEKRKSAIEDLVDKVQSSIDDGANFTDAIAAAKLTASNTPLIMASGASRVDPAYKLPPELAPALKSGFELSPSDQPDVVSLPGDAGVAVVSPAQTVPAAPAPFESIRAQVTSDWLTGQATQRARTAATQIAAKATGNVSLADAIKSVGVALPAPRPVAARRIQVASSQANVPAPLRTLFSIGAGKSKMEPNPQGGFFVTKVDKVTPGNAILSPGLITQVQSQLGQAVSDDYAEQFLSDIKRQLKVKRNESAIEALRARLLSSGG
jgi:peptidyl-prolyl cis-trans isomerase D